MTEPPAKRRYRAKARQSAADDTRRAILQEARALFLTKGYVPTTMQAIASGSGVAIDTVYASVGRKADVFRLLIETAISGGNAPEAAEDRDYVRAIRAASRAEEKIAIYARALALMLPRLAPLLAVAREASLAEPSLAALWDGISQRRAANMRLFAQDLAVTGQLRTDLSIDRVADVVWSMNSAEYYLLLTGERGWSSEDFGAWLEQAWIRLLLTP